MCRLNSVNGWTRHNTCRFNSSNAWPSLKRIDVARLTNG